jgi:hypothetical protein
MSQVESYDIVGSYNNQRYTSIDAERTVNMFEYIDPKGKKDKTLIFTSGLQDANVTFLTPGGAPQAGGVRASFQYKDSHYQVVGNGIYRVDSNGAAIHLVSLSTFTGYVGIDANQFQIIFVDGVNGYIYDTNTAVMVQITDTSFPTNPIDCCYLDGFFVVISGLSNAFQLSSFNQGLIWGPDFTTGTGNAFLATSGSSPNLVLGSGDTLNYQVGTPIQFNGAGTLPTPTTGAALAVGTTYYVSGVVNSTTFTISRTDGGATLLFSTTGIAPIFVTNNGQLQQGQVTSHPGTLVACRTLHRRIFFFSQNFTEVWENSGIGSNLPFRRNNSSLIEVGCAAIGSVATNFDKMFFLSADRGGLASVMQVIGTDAFPISTRALDFQLSQYDQDINIGVADARGILVRDNGLIFYRLNFTRANHTYVYNVTLSNPQSDEGKLWHEEEVLNGDRHLGQTQVFFLGDIYYGDYKSPILYFVSPEFVTNDGESIRRMRIGRPITPPNYHRTRIDRFHLDVIQALPQQAVGLPNVSPILTENGLLILVEDSDGDSDYLMTESSDQDDSDITIVAPNPITYLSYSKDGGRTYGNKLVGTMGKIGQRTFRTVWRKLGTVPRGQGFTPKIEFFSQIPYVILGAAWYFEIMPE